MAWQHAKAWEPALAHARNVDGSMMQCTIAGIGAAVTMKTGPRSRMTRSTREKPQMTRWIRFEHGGKTGFGTVEGDTIAVHDGDLFAGARPTGKTLKLSEVEVRTPC